MSAAEGRFPVEAWEEIFSTVPPYETGLSDNVIRSLAGLGIRVREAGEQIAAGLEIDDHLLVNMPLSLISSGLKHLAEAVGAMQTAAMQKDSP